MPIAPSVLFIVHCTSGTTGKPKGVISTHGQNLRAFSDWSAIVGLRAGDRYLIINPFFSASICLATSSSGAEAFVEVSRRFSQHCRFTMASTHTGT